MRTWPALEIVFNGPADLLSAALLDYHVSAIDETAADAWRVFFATPADRDAARAGLGAQFPDLTCRPIDIPDEDWAARSQAGLRAIRVGNIVVAPPWDASGPPATGGASPLVVVIQPSMGFGTGHHATTRLCLAALQQLDLTGRRVIDIGTGSGVLAIAASRLGASAVLGIDDDPDALQAAQENLRLNAAAAVRLQRADVQSDMSETFDVVVANLTGGLLIRAAQRLQNLAAASGTLVLSGLLRHEEGAVRTAYGGLAIRDRTEEDEWVCLTLQRT